MTYRRTLPRDLFNEADLLKMLGRLWIALDETPGHDARFAEEDVDSFEIVQDPSSGAIRVANLTLEISGQAHRLERPLNARTPWPLWLFRDDDEDLEIRVFDEQGALSTDMLALLASGAVGGKTW